VIGVVAFIGAAVGCWQVARRRRGGTTSTDPDRDTDLRQLRSMLIAFGVPALFLSMAYHPLAFYLLGTAVALDRSSPLTHIAGAGAVPHKLAGSADFRRMSRPAWSRSGAAVVTPTLRHRGPVAGPRTRRGRGAT